MSQLKSAFFCTLLLIIIQSFTFAQQRPELIVQTGHANGVTMIVFSPDGKTLASGGVDNSIIIWDTVEKRQLRRLSGYSREPRFVAFGANGQTLAGGSIGENKLWDVEKGTEQPTFGKFRDEQVICAYTTDGKILAATASSKGLQLYDAETGEVLRGLDDAEKGSLEKCAISPDRKILAAVYFEGTLKLWDVQTGHLLRSLNASTKRITSLAFSANNKLVATGGDDGVIKIWNVSNGALRKTFAPNVIYNMTEPISALAFTPDARFIVSGGQSEIALRDVASGRKVRSFTSDANNAIANGAQSVAISSDGETLATSGENNQDRTIKLWNVNTGERIGVLAGRSTAITSVAFNSDGKSLFTATNGETIKLWNMSGGDFRSFKGLSQSSNAVAFSPDGKFLAAGAGYLNNSIVVRDVTSGNEAAKLDGHENWVHSLAFSADGALLASVSISDRDKSIKLWNARTGKIIRTFEGHSYRSVNVALTPDGRFLISGGHDVASPFSPTIKIWDARAGKLLRTIKDAGGDNPIVVSPDGETIAAISEDGGKLNLFDVKTGATLRTLTGNLNTESLSFSPNGKFLAAGLRDNSIALWNVSTGELLHPLSGHTNWVMSVNFSPNGKLLLSGSRDGQAKIWDWAQGVEIASLIALNEKDWLVVTPDGLFDGSPESWNQVLWRYERNTFNVAPIEWFFNEFYYPNLLADILAGKRPRAENQLGLKDRRQPQLKLMLATNEPTNKQAKPPTYETPNTDPYGGGSPVEVIETPTYDTPNATTVINMKTRNATVRIEVIDAPPDKTYRAGSGAIDMRLFRNGALVKAWRGDVLKGQTRATFDVTLPVVAGENRFTAYAFNLDNVKSKNANLSIMGADSLKRAGTAYILAIGVNKYANANFDLRYAVADSEDFASEVKQQQERLKSYTSIEITPLRDEQATKANILKSLSDIAAKAQPEDAVFVYFAGHGTAEQKQFYLIPHDLGFTGDRRKINSAALQTILAHSISDRELELAFEKIDAGQLLLVIDACESGQALEAEERRRGPMNSKGLAQLAYEKGMYILTAAQSFQAAQEAAQIGHGFLTYALVEEGLKQSKADDEPRDGLIKMREWLDYATARVPQMQLDEMKRARSRGLNVAFVEGEEKVPEVNQRNIQRPRVFYRREIEPRQLVVAKP